MSEQPLQCEIVTPERLMFSQMADSVIVPASTGEMGFYPLHAPIICMIVKGCIRVTPAGEQSQTKLAVIGGYVEVDGEHVTVLADRAALMNEVDISEVNKTINDLEQEVSQYDENDEAGFVARSNLEWNKLLQHISQVA